jgi:hypothetical protein
MWGGSLVAALVALLGAWACGSQVPGGGGTGGHSTGGAHTASTTASNASAGGAGGGPSSGGGGGAGSTGAGGGPACPAGETRCNGVCVDVETDTSNCGACGAACVVLHATAACTQGACTIATCDPDWTDCNLSPTDGCEANLENDPFNCGQCGFQCDAPCICELGMCALGCPKGLVMCNPPDPKCATCDTQLGSNQNCNFCFDVCALPNATSQCTSNPVPPPAPEFMCALVSCDAGFADCDMVASNGCEVDTTTDPAHCGACGNACASSQTCSGGTCQ